MTQQLVALLLADVHIGQPFCGLDAEEVHRSLFKSFKEDNLKPDVILFAGDLCYGRDQNAQVWEEQWKTASRFLKEVRAAVGNVNTPVLLVPGNHDCDLDAVERGHDAWVTSLDDESLRQEMSKNDSTWRGYLRRQQRWQDFAKEHSPPGTLDTNLNLTTAVIKVAERSIGIAGFNSSWASSKDIGQGKIWIGRHQMQQAIARLENCDFRIAVSHFPTSWLNPTEAGFIKGRLKTSFDVSIHGHVHEPWADDVERHLALSMGATYELSTRKMSYSWLQVDFCTSACTVRMKTHSDNGRGAWIPLSIPGLDQDPPDSGTYVVHNLFGSPNANRPRAGQPAQDHSLPGILLREVPTTVRTISDCIKDLDRNYCFDWKPETYPSEDKATPLVYWPVRLRHPTPIHAAQAFAAAALQKCGAHILLCLDDLGTPEDYNSPHNFLGSIQRWFRRVGADDKALNMATFSEVLKGQNIRAWPNVQNWLGTSGMPLDRVLKVCKLIDNKTKTLEQLTPKKSRKLLTPAVVWTCLDHFHIKKPDRPIITLGGNDEMPLWKAWRECVDSPGKCVGHLYIAELGRSQQPIHMDTESLAWSGKADIRATLKSLTPTEDTLRDNPMIQWFARLCVLFPAHIKGGMTTAQHMEFDDNVKRSELIPALVDQLAHWLFS